MWQLACRNLFRNFRRTMAVVCTVALGTGALFAFDGFIRGVLDELRENTIHANYGFGQIYAKGYRETLFEDPTQHWIANQGQLAEFLSQLEGVESLFPRASFSALLKHDHVTVAGSGQGIDAEREALFFHSLNIEEGEALTTQSNGIVLGRGLANALHVVPGDLVTVMATSTKGIIKKDQFVVTGIFHTGSLEFDNRMFRIQLPAAQHLLNTTRLEHIALELRSLSDWDRVAEAIEEAFPDMEAISFSVLDKVYYQHSVDWLNAQFGIVQVIILSIVLLGIFNTVSTAILERKQEIGNLRANGESVFQIMRLILAEGALLVVLGSVVGILSTYVVCMFCLHQGLLMPPGPGQTRQFLVSFSFEWWMALYTLFVSCGAALTASFLAGIRVARMPIAQALRAH